MLDFLSKLIVLFGIISTILLLLAIIFIAFISVYITEVDRYSRQCDINEKENKELECDTNEHDQ